MRLGIESGSSLYICNKLTLSLLTCCGSKVVPSTIFEGVVRDDHNKVGGLSYFGDIFHSSLARLNRRVETVIKV